MRILLLENKDLEQKKFTLNLEQDGCIDNILGNEKCNEILNNFLDDNSVFDEYDTIIIHESIEGDLKKPDLFTVLSKYMKNKNLIKFSGNTTQFSLENEFTLALNRDMLYKNLESFLKSYKTGTSKILMLALGKGWSLNALLNSLEELNIFIENNTKDTMNKSIFSSRAGLTKIKQVSPKSYEILFQEINSNNITKIQMKSISKKLEKLIRDKEDE